MRNISLATMQSPGEMPMPAPMALAVWLGDKFNRLYPEQREYPERQGRERSPSICCPNAAWPPSRTRGWPIPKCRPATTCR